VVVISSITIVLLFFFEEEIPLLILMGSSRRRKKKHKSSSSAVRVGKVKQTRQFVEVKPLKLPGANATTREAETNWNKETSCVNNYSRNGLVSNANRFYYAGGRNALADNVKNMDDEKCEEKEESDGQNVDRERRSGRVEESRRREEFLRHRETETIDAETEENLRNVDVKTR